MMIYNTYTISKYLNIINNFWITLLQISLVNSVLRVNISIINQCLHANNINSWIHFYSGVLENWNWGLELDWHITYMMII